ncbi:tetratricopeptide repeat protein [Veillonella caviae]|uniref:tetratricopeptide repeat protein n=1 Tax=Veillonella caviae TaxID=248316 RepID=UPI002353135E|nr:hypothetical protein [Veillonella caviae]
MGDFEKDVMEFLSKVSKGKLPKNISIEDLPPEVLEALQSLQHDGDFDYNPMGIIDEAYRCGEFNEAIKILDRGVRDFPGNIDLKMAKIKIHEYTVDVELREIQKLIKRETKKLIEKENLEEIGDLYSYHEYRPYMRMRYAYMMQLYRAGHILHAIEEAEWILSVSEYDGMGVRYILMSLYAEQINIDKAKALKKTFKDDMSLSIHLPLAVLYYRMMDYKKAYKCIERCLDVCPKLGTYAEQAAADLHKYIFNEIIHEYELGSEDEFIVALQIAPKLYLGTPHFLDWISEEVDYQKFHNESREYMRNMRTIDKDTCH